MLFILFRDLLGAFSTFSVVSDCPLVFFRRELLDHMIPINERHLEYLLGEYVHKYYNTHRTHQGIGGTTPIPSPEYPPTTMAETKLKARPVLGGLYHTYEKVA